MKITRLKNNRGSCYSIDDKIVSRDGLDEICKKFLTADGLVAMWHRIFDSGVCVLDLDIEFDNDENKILAKKNSELEKERTRNAALEKKLMQFRIKAAKYDAMMSAMRTQTV